MDPKKEGRESDIQTYSLDFGRLDLVLLYLLVKGTAWYAEARRCLFHSTALFLQYSFDVLLFEFEKSKA